MSGKSMSKFPFTATQWQELEHQALIFKYMASGIPIPPDLLFTIKRSHLDSSNNSSSLPSKLLISHHPQHVGWNCFQMGLGRKIDPEPGRCRRTDGKKWRCSKEAFPDSKYCERHMHRGKNRSRKPVEVLKTPTSVANTNTNSTSTLTNSSQNPCSLTPTLTKIGDNCLSSISLSSSDQNRHNLQYYPCYNTNVNAQTVVDQNPSFAYQQYHTTCSRPNGVIGLSSSQDSNGSMLLDSDLRNRYVCGLKEEVDEHAFFSEEPSRTVRGLSSASSMEDSWQFTPLTMSCSSSSTVKHNHENSYLQLQSANYSHKHHDHYYKQSDHDHDHDHQHFDLLGRDLVKLDRREDQTQKTIHFFDEWPMREKDSSTSWLDLDDKSSNASGSISTTQLSISMPKSSYEFPIFSSRTHNGD